LVTVTSFCGVQIVFTCVFHLFALLHSNIKQVLVVETPLTVVNTTAPSSQLMKTADDDDDDDDGNNDF